jgi:tetratricopeptide (TPR) repeat protein
MFGYGNSARLFALSLAILVAPWARVGAQPPGPEDERERQAMERFLSLLERNPRRGTALDRVYGYHVERGTLDAFVKRFEDRVARDPNDGAGWMVLGLLESQRGQDAAAIKAFGRAEAARPDDPLPAFYLGQSLVLIGRPEEAAAAYERALQRKPRRNDLLDIFQALGRVYQRGQKLDQALEVWARLEQLFPGDPQVQEQVASALAEEGQAEPALARYERLAKSVRDPFRHAQLAMTAADLKVRLGRTEPALHDFESLLGRLRPDSWLYREVRRKIEDVFLRNDDQAGLSTYYERWIQKNPEDVEALTRLGRSLAAQGRAADARGWYEKAVKLAPTRRDLRLALIGQLVQDHKFADAAAQYEALDRAEPNNPDTLRDWGGLVLRDTSRPEAARKAAAGAIWRKLLEAKPKDPVSVAQVADLFRQAEMVDDALALYRQAIALAPGDAKYREYLGEYLHALKRPDEARAAWTQIAEGPNRNAKSLARLAEVLSGFGYVKEAIPPLTEAVALDRDNFDLNLKLAELLHRSERYDDARARLVTAEKLAESDEEKSAALEAQVKNDQAAGQLAARAEALRKEIDANAQSPAPSWARLARYLEADGKLPDAGRAIAKAIELDPRSVQAWTLAARIRDTAGNLGDAADSYRRLAEIDRRNRTEYLTQVAKLEARLGRTDRALKAGRDLIAAAPGNPEHYEFFAQLCFQLGRADDGLDALRRAARVNPNDTKILLTLAETLAGQFRIDEAIEMYWRSYDKSEQLDDRISTVSRLTELYLQRNQLDRLLARLQRERAESQQKQREASICLAQAYASSGDLGMARSELERLLAGNPRDVQLLQQLSKLAEEEGDLEGAAKHQKQLNELAPSDEGQLRLAQLYVRHGEIEEAQGIWTRMALDQKDTNHMLQAIDRLLGTEKPAAVLEITEAMIRKDPHDWEALYREGLALAEMGKKDDAAQRFRRLLDLRRSDDDKGAYARARSRNPQTQSVGTRPSAMGRRQTLPLEDRVNASSQVRRVTRLENRIMYATATTGASWTPADFGQARMAALGWLVSLARAEGKPKEDALIAGFRAAKDRVPRDPRALWDWYYLNLALGDNTGMYEAARDLNRAESSDPLALWVYLSSLGNRQYGQGPRYYVAPGTEGEDGTPPLPADEIEPMVASYRALRQRRPELAARQILGGVAAELKRSKRADLADTLYRESIEGARQVDEVASVIGLAGERGDVDGLIALTDRFERLQAGRSSPFIGTYYFEGPAYSMAQGMSARARAKAYGDVLRLLDHYLASARHKHEQGSAARGRSNNFGNLYGAGNVPYYQIWSGRTTKQQQIVFPIPNEYYDYGAITILRSAYELYKADDLTSDLVAHFRKQAEASRTAADALYPRLALSYLNWWEDDKDAAVAEFTRVAGSAPPESPLRLDLADLQEKRGEPGEALTLIDTLTPQDNPAMRRREETALRLAITTGNLERARQASERLFGLRLDTEAQVQLAGQMHQLGLHELAEALLSRARRRAGNKATALVGLMLQYQRQDKIDAAVQAALQILQGTTAMHTSNPNVYNPNNTDAARNSAIQVLARSGKIQGIIDRAEEQLKRTPNAVQLHQALADYYRAAGRRDRARAELIKVAELRPDDANLRLQVGNQLLQEGQAEAALPHFKAAFQKDPSVTMRSYYQIERAFQQARKTDELLEMLETMDIRRMGRSYYVMNTVQNLLNDESMRGRIMKLFRKAWEAFPQERSNLLAYIHRDDIWQMPEMYDYALGALIPEPASYSPYQQWYAFQRIISYGGDGKINSMVGRLLDMAAAQNKLEDLSKKIEEARKRFPAWKAGDALEAMIAGRAGRYDEAERRVEGLLKETGDQRIDGTVYWIIGNELENYTATKGLAMRVYERCVQNPDDDPFTLRNYEYSPMKRLVQFYVRDGRREDARRVLLDLAKPHDFPNYDQDYINQMRMQGLAAAARQLAEIGFPADAVPMFNEALAAAETPSENDFIGNRQGLVQSARQGLDQALQGLKDEQLIQTVRGLLESPAGDMGDGKSKATAAAKKARDQAVDLVLLIHPRGLDKAAIRSLFADSVAAGAREPKLFRAIEEPLKALRARSPDDLSVRIAAALTALAGGDAGRIKPALDALGELVDRTPLEPLPEGAHANTRQRAEALRQVPLWLVARACWKQKDYGAYGDRFAARAIEAARRQSDNRWTMAMLREKGQLALDRGDAKGVEAEWGRMLDLILARRPEKKGPAAGPRAVPAPTEMVTAPAAASVTARTKAAPRPSAKGAARTPAPARLGNVPILTLDRFDQAMQVARLAADKGLTGLSVRALREALKGGPPVVVATPQDARRARVMRAGVNPDEPPDEVTPRVIAQLVELEGTWQRRKAPAGQVYEALRDVAMPDGRPAEIFLYAQSLDNATLSRPRSLGAMLAVWAVRAGKADDLRQKIESRRGQPMAEFPATVLAAQLALAGGEPEPANRALKAISERLKRDTLRPTTDLASHAALPALERPETRDVALAVLDACVKSHEATEPPESVKTLLLVMARRQLQAGDVAGGRKRLEQYLEAGDRSTVRYVGDYPLYLRKLALRTIAAEYAQAGLGAELLQALGDFVDAPTSQENYGGAPPTGDLLGRLAGQLASRPARERYESLRAWTMPTPKRRMVRILSALSSDDAPPAGFLKTGNAPGGGKGRDATFSTATALIEAAREAGALDKLAAEARAAAAEKVENADDIRLLIELASGRGNAMKPQLEARLQEVIKDADAQADPSASTPRGRRAGGQGPRPFPWADYLLARMALNQGDTALQDLGMRLLDALLKPAQRLQDQAMLAQLRSDMAAARARRAQAPALAERTDGSLALWHPSSHVPMYFTGTGSTPSRWVAHQGHIAHIAGPGNDSLLFDYPLTGTFELSLEAYSGPWAEANLTYGGLSVEPFWQGYGSVVSPIGGSESITRPWRLERSGDFNRITVQVTPQKVRYLVNGHLFYEDDDPSPTSPWLGLYTHRERQTAWRNLALRGEPTIPRVVRLSQGDRLEGWVSAFYNESQPPRRTTSGVDRYGNTTQLPRRSARPGATPSMSPETPIDPDAFDWCALDGVIRGRRMLANPGPRYQPYGADLPTGQSRLYYHRPMRDGDVLSYEFLYEPDQVMVHPAIDRLAFRLEPDGVRLHWMTLGSQDPSGIPADNVLDEPENRRGPAKLPLRPGEWNAMRIELNGDRIALSLNGQSIYQRTLEPANGRQFGLFHDKERTSAQVRNVELRGHWPGSLPAGARADLAALRPSEPNSEADRRARQAMIGEAFFSLQADEILARARGMKPEERYALLIDWVLPNADHADFRVRGEFAPTDPTPPPSPGAGSATIRRRTRMESGGEVRAPALELVATATALGRPRLDELAERVEKAPAEGDVNQRARLALLALIAMARGDDRAAALLDQVKPLLEKQSPDAPEWERWPELTVAVRAIERDRLRPKALALLGTMVDQAHKKNPRSPWVDQVSNLRARARLRDELGPDAPPFGTDPEIRDWARVTHARAETRGAGEPIPHWTYRDGRFTHHPGHANDMMYLRTPLRGDFQLDCELAIFDWRETRVAYGGMTVAPKYDLKHVERWHFNRALPELTLNPPLERPADWYKYRLVVKGGSMTSFVNGRQIHQAPLTAECDPWLALQCFALNTGGARNLTITGRPVVPESLSLTGLPDLTGWLPEYYGDSVTGDRPDWEKQGEEVVGRLREDFAGSKQESVLFYHRPMLEDGEIAYEFYHEPGKTMVHPTLDRLAFLLDPDGVKVHRLTDAQHERTGLAPDNAAVEPDDRRGPSSLPLKAREWNRLVLTLSGDRVALRLNGQLIYERTLEATNQRLFGLFHYADETEARVRKVHYRGDWPRSLPEAAGPRQNP